MDLMRDLLLTACKFILMKLNKLKTPLHPFHQFHLSQVLKGRNQYCSGLKNLVVQYSRKR